VTTSTAAATQDPAAGRVGGLPAPRWAVRLAHLVPLLVLPSGLWRLAVAFGFPMGQLDDAGRLAVLRGWPAVYVAALSLLAEAVALTALGLVRPLGEEIPRWVPVVGARAVRPRVVLLLATAGSVALVLIWTVGFWPVWTGQGAGQVADGPWAAVFVACYASLNLWGPAVLVLAWAYRRRVVASGKSRRGPVTGRRCGAATPPRAARRPSRQGRG